MFIYSQTEIIQFRISDNSITNDNTHNSSYIVKNNSKPKDKLFWSNISFNASWYLDQLSTEITDAHTYEICQQIIKKANSKWSQAYQDWIVFHNFFYGKINGIYIDIGANSPIYISNTVFFDVCMGWKGICVEPSNTSLLFEHTRSCTMAKHCVSSKTQNLTMLFSRHGKDTGYTHTINENAAKNTKESDVFKCMALSGQDLFNLYKPKNKYNEMVDLRWNNATNIMIDYISLDIEGSEVDFLKCFPFNKYDVKVWTIEINKGNTQKLVDEIMYFHGYRKYAFLPLMHYELDAVYIKADKLIQRPYTSWHHYTECNSKP